jgi:heat shock protein HslJ
MEQEHRFLEAMGKVQRWDVSEVEQLQLWPAQGLPLRFWPEEG